MWMSALEAELVCVYQVEGVAWVVGAHVHGALVTVTAASETHAAAAAAAAAACV